MRQFIKLFSLIYLIVISQLFSQNLSKVKEFLLNNEYYDVQVVGNYAYIVTSQRFLILDVTNKTAPEIAGYYNTFNNLTGVEVVGDYAYVAGGKSGLLVFSVADKSNPSLIGTLATSDSSLSLKVSGGYAYLADWNGGMKVINISTPSSPTLVSSVLSGYNVVSVDVKDTIAYVSAGDSGLILFNATNKSALQRLGKYTHPSASVFWDVAVKNNYAYIAGNEGGLVTVDVTNPSNPVGVDIDASAGFAFSVSYNGYNLFVSNKVNGFNVYNLFNPANPSFAVNHTSPVEVNAYSAVQSVNHLYVANGNSFQIYDISALPTISLTSNYISSGYVSDILSKGNYLFVATTLRGLHVFDVSNPAAPALVGNYTGGGGINGMASRDSFLYIACSRSFQILNISNPVNPYLRGEYTYAGQFYAPFRVSVPSDSVAYVVGGNLAGVSVLEIKNVESITEKFRYSTGPIPIFSYSDVTSRDTLAFVTNNNFGFRVLRLNPNFTLSELGFHNSGGYAGINLNNYIYIAAGSLGLRIIDISNYTSPFVTSTFNTEGDARGVKVANNYAYVADGIDGLEVLNVQNSYYPMRSASINTPGNATRIDVNSNTIYVADLYSLLIYNFTPSTGMYVHSPNGGETWLHNSSKTIHWTGEGFSGNVNIKLSTNDGTSYDVMIASDITNSGYYSWVVSTAYQSTQCRILIESVSNPLIFDASDANFTIQTDIVIPSITVTYPNGGEEWYRDSTYSILWTSENFSGNVNILLSIDGGTTYSTIIASNVSNTGSYVWKVPVSIPSPGSTLACKVKVESFTNSSLNDVSNSTFAIRPPVGVDDEKFPADFALTQNYPNPFNPSTTISYSVPEMTKVKIEIYDMLGRLIDTPMDEIKSQGNYSLKYYAENLSSGVYFYRMTAGKFVEMKKMNLLK